MYPVTIKYNFEGVDFDINKFRFTLLCIALIFSIVLIMTGCEDDEPVEKEIISIKEQILEPFQRQGFTVVEWGGAIVN